ncbi:hypothetical protein [Sphingomonas sp. CFBP 13706]|uniref:hypothetical protein n=1 Tax=Sphingomonas sp. CFBP 13706 TaxID=2775314 RepID=UPI00177FE7C3|nr:hypothetical protein [Sphingomonas sp. CFBP 13706]MBD8735360.1 hypothetical protein [Sphingomonas sp. CFBP 13706]
MNARILLLGMMANVPAAVCAEPTKVVVRVISADAKFVGDHTGGAKITIRAVKSGRTLAQGVTKGGTGDTNRIMEAAGRNPLIQTAEAASFTAMIDIDRPTLVELEAEGPLKRQSSIVHVRSQRWIMPGQAVDTANGWMVELPGLAITPTVSRADAGLSIEATVELMCGCPITPDGNWKSEDYKVSASIWNEGKMLTSTPLAFVSSPGGFAGTIRSVPKGATRVVVFALNDRTGNSGLVESPVPR